MNRKKIEQFVKEYFYFSNTERRGIFLLLLLLLAVTALPFVYNKVFPPKPLQYTVETLPVVTDMVATQTHMFVFDPNTAGATELQQLGFSTKQITTIQRYLAKGGRFKQPDDLRKLYGMKPELVEQLIPFVQIATNEIATKTPSDTAKKYQAKGPVELNTADTTSLIALYRIGPAMAKRIVEYRERLGGFLSLNQLTEIYGFDEDILYDLQGKIMVDPSKAKIFNLNTVTVDELKTHPYFKYKLSNAIVNYRLQHGPYQSLTDLKKIVIVNDSIYNNIIRYLMLN